LLRQEIVVVHGWNVQRHLGSTTSRPQISSSFKNGPHKYFRLYNNNNDDDEEEEENIEEEDIGATFTALIQDIDDNNEDDDGVMISPGSSRLTANLPNFNGYSMPMGKKGGYSAFLEKSQPRWLRNFFLTPTAIDDLNEDGYADMTRKKRSILKQTLKLPLNVARKAFSKKPDEPGTLILVRHGESEWNKNKTFTGWADPDLTEQGRREVEHAARLLMAGGYKIDVAFTSRLKRAIRSVWILLRELDEVYLPVFKSWRLVRCFWNSTFSLVLAVILYFWIFTDSSSYLDFSYFKNIIWS
jgi:hypothetical protein